MDGVRRLRGAVRLRSEIRSQTRGGAAMTGYSGCACPFQGSAPVLQSAPKHAHRCNYSEKFNRHFHSVVILDASVLLIFT